MLATQTSGPYSGRVASCSSNVRITIGELANRAQLDNWREGGGNAFDQARIPAGTLLHHDRVAPTGVEHQAWRHGCDIDGGCDGLRRDQRADYGPRQPTDWSPVSYTHLRAHET